MKKLLELKFNEWEKGLSYETSAFVGGVFKTFSNCDPFKGRGAFTPTNAVAEIGSGTLSASKVIRAILPVSASETSGEFYVLADDYKLYRVSSSDVVSDVSAQIASGTASAKDMTVWKGLLIYATSTQVRSNIIPVSSGSDAQILSAVPTSNLCIGPDGNLYVGISNNVGKMILSTGTSGNTTSVAASLTSGTVQKLLTDGRYLIWIATSGLSENNSIIVAFWNLTSSNFDQLYEWNGGNLGGAEFTGDFVKIVTSKGIWVCNFATTPKLLVPFGGAISISDIPYSSSVGVNNSKLTGIYKGSLLWMTYGASGRMWGYGNPVYGQPNRLYQFGTSTANTITAFGFNNAGKILHASGTSGNVKLFSTQGSASLNSAIANVAGFSFGKPYTFHHARVILKSPISSGNSVSLEILTANSVKTILATSTKTNSTDSGERNLVFDHVTSGDASDVRQFEDISDVKLTTNVAVNSLEIWGDEADDRGSYG